MYTFIFASSVRLCLQTRLQINTINKLQIKINFGKAAKMTQN